MKNGGGFKKDGRGFKKSLSGTTFVRDESSASDRGFIIVFSRSFASSGRFSDDDRRRIAGRRGVPKGGERFSTRRSGLSIAPSYPIRETPSRELPSTGRSPASPGPVQATQRALAWSASHIESMRDPLPGIALDWTEPAFGAQSRRGNERWRGLRLTRRQGRPQRELNPCYRRERPVS